MNRQSQCDNNAVHGNHGDDDNAAYFNSIPPGFRFCPTDEELIIHYLEKRIMNQPLPVNRIREVDLYKHNPDHLAEMYRSYKEEEWYFLTPRNRKYKRGKRPSRSAGNGYWKATTADTSIESNGKVIGQKKLLNFFIGKAPKSNKSNWIMHEFRVEQSTTNQTDRGPNGMKLDNWVLCRIYRKQEKSTREVKNTEIQVQDVDTSIEDGDYSDVVDEDSGLTNNVPNNSINPSGEDESSDHSLQYNLPPLPSEPYFTSDCPYMANTSFDYEDPNNSSNINFDNGDPSTSSIISFDYGDPSTSSNINFGNGDPSTSSNIGFDYRDPSSSSNINFDNGDPSTSSIISFDYRDPSSSSNINFGNGDPSTSSNIGFDYRDPSSSSNINFDNGDPYNSSNINFDYGDISISVDEYMLPQYDNLDPLPINYLPPDNIVPNVAGNVTDPTDEEILQDPTTADLKNNKRHKSK